jgi:hypothetical protein
MHLCQIDVPEFDAARAFVPVRAYLLDRFPEIVDVLPTPRPAALVIGYRGTERLEAWAEALDMWAPLRRSAASRSEADWNSPCACDVRVAADSRGPAWPNGPSA